MMKLGVFVSHDNATYIAREAENLGYAMALTPEGFRSDAVSVLGAIAACTQRIGLAAGVMQIPARTPVMTALTAATLDDLSGGRFRLGLGVSNARVSHGWYGVPFAHPLGRTREYVAIVRAALRGEPVHFQGRHFTLPPAGVTEAAHLNFAPVRADVPLYLGGIGPQAIALAGEIGDGWIGSFCSPARIEEAVGQLGVGRARAGLSLDRFEVVPSVPLSFNPDLAEAANPLREYYAYFLGLGGTSSRYHALAARMGYGTAAAQIQELRRAGDFTRAARVVPFELIDELSLLGSTERIARRIAEYARAGVTTLGITLPGLLPLQSNGLQVAATALRLAEEQAAAVSGQP
jgi:F420-dependent oxidoreductase-like protein